MKLNQISLTLYLLYLLKGNISKKDLLNYTMFQIYDEYKRLIHIDQYDTNIMALMQGAKNVKLKHWSSKIQY